MGCLWCGKYSRQCKIMPSGPPEFIPPFIPVTGMKCSYGKISSPLTEISGTEPARPLIWTHRKFYKGFRGEARSRKPGQPGQPGSYEALNDMFLLNYDVHSYNTRSKNSFRLPYCRTNVRKFSHRFQGPKIFNSLSSEIQNASSTGLFNSKLKSFFLGISTL